MSWTSTPFLFLLLKGASNIKIRWYRPHFLMKNTNLISNFHNTSTDNNFFYSSYKMFFPALTTSWYTGNFFTEFKKVIWQQLVFLTWDFFERTNIQEMITSLFWKKIIYYLTIEWYKFTQIAGTRIFFKTKFRIFFFIPAISLTIWWLSDY